MKKVEIKGYKKLISYINKIQASDKEELVVCFGKTAISNNSLIFLINSVNFAEEAYLSRDYYGLKWNARLTAKWVKKAEEENKGILLLHAHHNNGKVNFSPTDETTKHRILEHFGLYLPTQLSGYAVVGLSDFKGEFVYKNNFLPLSSIKIISIPLIKGGDVIEDPYIKLESHNRQELALGEKANKMLQMSTVVIVGLGGAGSMVAQQLAHMKIKKIILIDGDKIEESNLSRAVGSKKSDIEKYKTFITKRLIRSIDSTIKVETINNFFPTPKIYYKIKDADLIISCVDKISAKVALNNFSKRYLVPLIDVGVTIRKKRNKITNINGQVVRILPDGHCLRCIGIVSPALEAQEDVLNYGTDVKNPQVITFNGTLASIALGEALKVITGIGSIDNSTVYLAHDGLTGEVKRIKNPDFRCIVCQTQYAQGDPVYH